MKKILFLFPVFLFLFSGMKINAQNSVMNVNDTIVEYDVLNPPVTPNWGQLSKWVRTKRVSWNTDSYKCYFYKGMPFRLMFPLNYDTTGNTEYPLIVMFHGHGNYDPSLYDNEIPLHTGGDGGKRYRDAVDNGEFDGFVLFPQNTSGFFNQSHFTALHELFTIFLPDLHIDINRISLTGSSAGAYGVWNAAMAYPTDYAAILPMSGVSTNNIPSLPLIRQVPVWLFQGGQDKSPTPYTAGLVKAEAEQLGMDFLYTEYTNRGHGIWSDVYKEPNLIPYMIAANKVNPIVYHGKSEFCPGDTIYAQLAVSEGFDGYEWRKDGVLIAGADSNELEVTQLGIYDVRIKRGNDWSYWSPKPVEIKMKDATVTPPVEVVGLATHVLPSPDSVNEVTLVVPGNFEEYAWKLAGQATVLDTNPSFTISTPGSYVVTVTEKFGCESSDSPVFKVVDATAANGPGAPNNVNVFAVSKTSLKLVWNDHPSSTFNETAFEIYRSETAGGPYQFIGTSPADAVQYIDDNLISDKDYYYVIRAINNNAASAVTTEAMGTTKSDNIPPLAVTLELVKTTPNNISVRWNAGIDDVGVEKYEVFVGGIKSVVTTDTMATIYNLLPYHTYNITVKARDFAGNYSPLSTPLPVVTVFTGLNYKYYEGAWNNLPDFNNLTAVDSGHVDNIDISLKQVNDDYGFLWEGLIHIPVAGNYTFETRSDDGSMVFIGGYDTANIVVNNDGRHGAQYRSGTYNFPVAGVYPIAVTFFRNGSSETMQLYWKNTAHGIGSTRELIPDEAFIDYTPLPGNPPQSPANLHATAVSYNKINLSWADSSNNETGFQIFRKSGNGDFLPIVTTAANVTSYIDSNLTAATAYDYTITAVGHYGVSALDPGGSAFSINFNNNIDDQQGGLSSSLQNGATYTSNSIEGGFALLLDGVNDYVALGPNNGSGLFHDPFTNKTVAMWVKVEDHSGTRMIYDEGGTTQGLAIRVNNGQLEAAIRQSSNQTTLATAFTDTNWVHVAVVFDAGRFSLYVNGTLSAETPNIGYNEIAKHTNNGGLGATNGNSNAFGNNGTPMKGKIDDLHIYLSSLTEQEINGLILKTSIYDQAITHPLPAVPATPANLTATALSADAIELNWDDNSNNEEEFIIYRSVNMSNNFLPLEIIAGDTATGNKTFIDSGLFANLNYHYLVIAQNAGGADTSNSAMATTMNGSPSLDAIPDLLIRYNTTENIQLYATDPDGDSISLSTLNLPSFVIFTDYQDGSGLLSVSPLIDDTNDFHDIIIIATDAFGGTDSDTFNISVTDNFLPALSPIANVVMNEGDSVTVLFYAADSNGVSSLAWSASNVPSFASFSANNDGTAEMTFEAGYADGGIYNNIIVSIDDQNGGTAHEQFTLTVNEVNPNRLVKVNFRHSVAAASPWNNVNNVNPVSLNDVQGNPTGFGVDVLGSVWNSFNDGRITGNNSGIVPDDVLKEYYYFGIFGAPNTIDFNITGLYPAGAYNLSIIASSQWNGVPNNGTTKYTVNGQTDSVYAHFNTTNSADFSMLTPNASGNLTVSMSKAVNTQVGYINGFILEEVYDHGTAPAAARNLAATFAADAVQLSWYDAPYNEEGYNVFRSDSANGPYVQININTLPANAVSYNDDQVAENQAYYYKVQAINSFGTSSFSNVATAYVPNTAPAISVTGNILLDPAVTSVLEIEATDSPLNTIALSTVNLPTFATFTDSANGKGSISLTPSGSDAGTYVFTVKATDNLGAVRSQLVNITVKDQKLYSVYVNFSNTSNAAAPWNNTAKTPAVNDNFALNDDSSQPSGISLQLLTSFGGVFNEGAQTGDNSGIVPDNVLKEYYWFGIFGAPNQVQMKVSGLDNQKKYNFRFVGSSTFSGSGISDNGETNYTIGGETAAVDVQANTGAAALIEGVIADNNGEVFIDITKGNGASIGYINAMIIDVYEADTTRFDPANLKATAGSSSTIDLNWKDNSLDETAFEIQRSESGLEIDFVSIDTVGSNVVNYTDSGLSTTHVYHYRVRAIRGVSHTGFTNVASSGTIAFRVYININGNAVFDAPAPWNNLGIAPSDHDVYTGFINDLGHPSGMEMVWNKVMAGSNEWGVNTGNNSGIYPDNVIRSFFFSDAFEDPASITMRGLSQAYDYNFTFFGSIVTGYDIHTRFTIGNTTVTNAQTDNISEVSSIKGVNPDANNEIGIMVQEASGSNWAIFNAMVVEAVTAATLNSKQQQAASIPASSGAIAVHYGNSAPEIAVYPNPVTGNQLNIGFRDAVKGKVEVVITDLTGRMIQQNIFHSDLTEGTIVVDLGSNELQSGVYIVRTQFADGRSGSTRFIKMDLQH